MVSINERRADIRKSDSISPGRGGDYLKIGFIGAGKVGVSLGMHILNCSQDETTNVIGYYDKSSSAAREAADLTKTKQYSNLMQLAEDSEMIFVTVSDDAISSVWENLKELPIEEKFVCHCSGSLTSATFSGINQYDAYGYSIHPLFAVSDKLTSYKKLKQAIFTIEGEQSNLHIVTEFIKKLGNDVVQIREEDKVRYHAAAVFGSNFVVGLADISIRMMMDCGFSYSEALRALTPLMSENMNRVLQAGSEASLTGPVERNDVQTVKKHKKALNEEERELYEVLSRHLVSIAKRKNKDKDYSEMEEIFK
ncbi:MAG: DUF2520 domain-containing protein [Clostridiales bacterium]|nr:DUF2520 domain-containing protein [Clostridiales bacterium]